jgi:hypothetical protein
MFDGSRLVLETPEHVESLLECDGNGLCGDEQRKHERGSSMSAKASFFIGFVVCLAVFVWNGINVVSLCLIVLALGVIVLGGERAASWTRTSWARLHCQFQRLWPSSKKKQVQAEREKLMKQLKQHLNWLGAGMCAFSEANRQQTMSTWTPIDAFWSEYLALKKSLTHLGTPKDSARISLDDLTFYDEWVCNLRHRFEIFQQQYIQQQQSVKRALSDAKHFHTTLGKTYERVTQSPEYWKTYGSFTTLGDLLNEGCVPPEALLPPMQSLQRSMEVLFAQHENGVL